MNPVPLLRRIFLVFGIALIVTVLLIILYKDSLEKYSKNSRMLLHSVKVLETCEELLSQIKDTEVGTHGYVATGDSTFLEPYFRSRNSYKLTVDKLRALTADNAYIHAYIDSLELEIHRKMEAQAFIIHLKQTDNVPEGYNNLFQESRRYMDRIRDFMQQIESDENRLMVYRNLDVEESIDYSRIMSTIFSVTAIMLMVLALTSILLEIRDKKKVHDILQAVLESSQSGIMSFAAIRNPMGVITDFRFLQVNPIGADIVGKNADELIGKTMLEVFPGNKSEGLFEAYVDVTENNSILKTEKFYGHDNLNIWFRIVAVKLNDGFTVTFDNINFEKQAELELQKLILELKRSNNELEQFAFVASHDLQEPLRKIQSFGDRLTTKFSGKLEDDMKFYVDKMLHAAGRMSNLISDLLSFSRLAMSNDKFIAANLNKIIDEVLTDFEIIIRSKNAEIHVETIPEIECIPSQMSQLFFNLIGNALKFSRNDTPPKIVISAALYEDKVPDYYHPNSRKEAFVKIRVADNGIGFENEFGERIFEIFQRLHGKSEYDGTGIGLAICKRIVSNHYGTITASSTLNAGSVFEIRIPVIQSSRISFLNEQLIGNSGG